MKILNYFSKEKKAERKQQKFALQVQTYHDNITRQLDSTHKNFLKDYESPLLILGVTEKILFREDAAAALSKIFDEKIPPEKMIIKLIRTDLLDNFSVWIYQDYFIEIGYKCCHYGIFDQRLTVFEKPYLNQDGVTFMSAVIRPCVSYSDSDILKESIIQFTLVYDILDGNIIENRYCNVCGPFDCFVHTLPSLKTLIYYNTYNPKPFSWDELIIKCTKELNERKKHAAFYQKPEMTVYYHRYLK